MVAGVDEEDLVGVRDRVQAMRDDDFRRRRRQSCEDLLEQLLGHGVDVRRRFVQDQDFRIPQHRTHERDQLLLAEADRRRRWR